jgi:hypothetical protein
VDAELQTINIKNDSATLKGLIFVAKFTTKLSRSQQKK